MQRLYTSGSTIGRVRPYYLRSARVPVRGENENGNGRGGGEGGGARFLRAGQQISLRPDFNIGKVS